MKCFQNGIAEDSFDSLEAWLAPWIDAVYIFTHMIGALFVKKKPARVRRVCDFGDEFSHPQAGVVVDGGLFGC